MALCLRIAPVSAILTSVSPGEVFTVTEAVPSGLIVMFAFQLNPEYLLAVSATDRDSGAVLREWKDDYSGVLNIPPLDKKRVLQFSFSNADSMLTSIYVNYDIRVVDDPNYNVGPEDLDPIENKVQGLFEKIQKVKMLLQTLRYQQKDHRATVEDANERLLLWSVLQVVGFMVMSGAQLYLLKLFLERKRTV
ncbi:hypothetical protein ABB37_06004 [Leptomonas pyrrhocoris]|uniref:GOLD domain-containing protein n=1 Tax=Leptomonas pyrrhocoris TaxID=157538 RepID=A0A0M9FYV4_LEPPY|nr:hypothetical protein ABB37_06004 [Leptomonas pyrrhocoris]KPA78940.1 hypothetical protein ABB37_06004 [Leptomonas pyrrhocoris]|eukprot:XP_015657379.1 hypothetical protein ABB37_06004 [Leptomonas pyrrhocoris]